MWPKEPQILKYEFFFSTFRLCVFKCKERANTLVGSVVRSLWPCLSGLGSSHLHSQLLVGILSGVDPLHDLARTAGAYVRSAPCPGVKYSHKGPYFC